MFTKNCILCGKEFKNRSDNVYVCNDKHIVNCSYCNKPFELRKQQKARVKNKDLNNLEFFCCRSCQAKAKIHLIHTEESEIKRVNNRKSKNNGKYNDEEKLKKNNLEKYGVEWSIQREEVQNKIKDTMIEKYGVKSAWESEEVINKRKQNWIEKYGVDNPAKVKQVIEQIKETNKTRYGADNPMKNKQILEKALKTNKERYGKQYLMQVPKLKDLAKEKCIEKYGVEYNCLTDNCIQNQGNTISKINQNFSNLLNNVGLDTEYEFLLSLKRYDIHILNTNILIEINPAYTHNVTRGPYFRGKYTSPIDKDYHINKTITAEENNYHCIHIWDWDNLDKVINMLKLKENLYARNLEIKGLNKHEANEFLNKYHLQNKCNGNIINLGLYKDNELIQLMTFGKPRYNKNYEYELLRLCTHKDYKVVGGSEKLFKFFIKTYNPKSVISYCDNSKFTGDVYKKLGFTLSSYGKPSKHWYNIMTERHITDNLLKQRGFDQLLGKEYGTFGKGVSNKELMLQRGFMEVYDCGQSTWIYKA